MCHRKDVCPLYLERTLKGISNACSNCEYVKRTEKNSLYYKIGLGITLVVFLVTTYIIY